MKQAQMHTESHTATTPDSHHISTSPGRSTGSSTPGSSLDMSAALKETQIHTESHTESHSTTTTCMPDSHHICASTSSGNQATTTSTSITGTHPKQTSVASSTPHPEHVIKVPEFQQGRVDAKKFPPRHYDINSLEIGTWKVSLLLM